MSNHLPRRTGVCGRWAVVAWAVWLSSTNVWASESDAAGVAGSTPDAGPPDGGTSPGALPPNVTPEELEAIERALEADAAEQPHTPAPSAPEARGESAAGETRSAFTLQSLNPDISLTADVALAHFDSDRPLQTGGHDPAETGFTLQQLELSLGKSVDPYFRFDASVVFSQFGVEVEEAYATTLALPHRLQLRIGQFLTRFGRLNATHLHAWAFVDQPFALGRVFGSENNRGLGGEVSWLLPVDWYVELVGSVTDAHGEGTARSFFGAVPEEIESPLDFQYTGAIKQFFPLSEDLSLLWGVSAATGPNPTGYRNRTDIWGTDLYLKYRPISDPANPTVLSLQAEIFYRRRQVPGDLLQDVSGYVEAFWRFEQRWGLAGRYEYGSPTWGRGGGVVIDPLDPEWIRARNRVSASVTFWPTEFSRIRLQTAGDFPRWRERPIWSLMLAFEFTIGAHGAHAF